jgi:pimeloyl-ACP methyl ester carboxylesterase
MRRTTDALPGARRDAQRVIRALLAAVVLLSTASLGAASPQALPLEPCSLQGGIEARCGTFTVREDRAAPGGRTLALRVAVIPARDGGTKRDPIVYLAGGPGGSAIASGAALYPFLSGLNASRDLVLVDQRGVGGSKQLSCGVPRTPPRSVAAVRAYIAACLAKLDADPRQYTTIPAMDDLEEVLRALGYTEVNLYGGSYGATAVQYFLRQHPSLVRTAIMDGGTMLDVPIFELYGRNGQRGLRLILERCARQRSCATRFPRVRHEVFEVMAALRRKPVRVGTTVIDPTAAGNAIQSLSRSPAGAADIPWVAHRARVGDWAPLARVVRQVAAPAPVVVMYWSIVCNEPWARRDLKRTAAASRGTYLAETTSSDARLAATVCSAMPKSPQPSWTAARVRSDKPVLLMVGGADPQDPLSSVANARRELPNSRTVVVPAGGHGSIQLGCMPQVAERFVDAGTAAGLDAGCAARYRAPPFRLR